MSDVGRNAPCPCGSGKKYKRCCGAPRATSTATSRVQETHDLDGKLVREVLRYGARRFPDAGRPDDAFEAEMGGDPEDTQILAPWAAYHWRVRGRTLAQRFLEERGKGLTPAELDWLEAQRRSWISIWEVTGVVPGESLALTDLLTGATRSSRASLPSRERSATRRSPWRSRALATR